MPKTAFYNRKPIIKILMLAYSVRVFKVTFGTTCATTIVPIEVMQVTSQALVRWRLIHFGRKRGGISQYLSYQIISALIMVYNLL